MMIEKKYILAHDLGTSANKATVYDTNGKLIAFKQSSYQTFYPFPHAVEQNPIAWWNSVCESTKILLDKNHISPENIVGVTFSGQMMGCVFVGIQGNILRNAIIWADSRANKEEEFLQKIFSRKDFYQITGHRPSAFYSLAKILWIREHEPEIYAKTHKILLAKDYLIYRFTNRFITDYSDASCTNMLDIQKKEWSDEIINKVGISKQILPELHSSTDIVGYVTPEAAKMTNLLEGTPVIAGGGDGACATVGAGVISEGEAYVSIGSSAWISILSRKPVFNDNMLTFNDIALDPQYYIPCGSMQTAGYSIQWLKNTICKVEGMEFEEDNKKIYDFINQKVINSSPGAGGVLFLPYLLGEQSPRWNSMAKGCFLNITMTTTLNDIMRSVLEGVAFNLKVILDLISEKKTIKKIAAIGGGAKNEVWMQIMADIWQIPIKILTYVDEAASLGAAIYASKSLGFFTDIELQQYNPPIKIIYPNYEYKQVYNDLYQEFNMAYIKLYGNSN